MSLPVRVILLVSVLSLSLPALAQDSYARRNTFTALTEYSNDSSHIFLGVAPNRKFVGLGLQYERRLLLGRGAAWSYFAEVRPLIFESDPTESGTYTFTAPGQSAPIMFNYGPTSTFKCVAGTSVFTGSGTNPTTQTKTTVCGRDWNYAQSLSPIGIRLNLRTRHRLQPTMSGSLGYMFATHPIPLDNAGSFNFVFEFGAGLELYRTRQRSMRFEYQLQHFSNKDTGSVNPGVDNGLIKLTYCFGQ